MSTLAEGRELSEQTRRPEVLKFGGSTLGDPARLRSALDIIAEARARASVAVVVSAPGDTTDHLLAAVDAATRGERASLTTFAADLACKTANLYERAFGEAATWRPLADRTLSPLQPLLEEIGTAGQCSLAARDRILAFGELTSAALLCKALRLRSIDALAVDARTWLVTDDRYGHADVEWDATAERVWRFSSDWLAPGVVTVHTGFLGATRDGHATTLGRNGSDYTAALLARALRAESVTIWTDVSGVMTADPSIVDEAYPVPVLSYREALELAGLGFRMLHHRTIVPLITTGIPLRVRNSARPADAGTLVNAVGSLDRERPTCVASLEDMAMLSIEGTHRSLSARVATRAMAALDRSGVLLSFTACAHHGNGGVFVVRSEDAPRAASALAEELAHEIGEGALAPPTALDPVSIVTLVGEAIGRTPNVSGRFFGAIGSLGVIVHADSQGSSSRAISCVVDAADTVVSVRAVHAAFNLARERVNVLLLGKGTVGGHFLEQVDAERATLREHADLDLRIFAVVDRTTSIAATDGLDPREAKSQLLASRTPADLIALLDRLRRLPVPVLVDCTGADGMERLYEEALSRGVHVVTANKKPFTIPAARRAALFAAARRAHRGLRYETTVGASLPVIETLKNLVRTGDRVRAIEGSFSGTLGFLANAVSGGERLSAAVRDAHARGYTEPNPSDDLSGVDVARKALILARELGFDLELDDIEVQPFAPARLLAAPDRELLFRALESHDATFAAEVAALRSDGRVLRYLARITAPAASSERARVIVGPVGVKADHPASRLRGTEALVAFLTDRYDEYPLVVQGAGAGGAVTAAGVLADVLSLSQTLRGR